MRLEAVLASKVAVERRSNRQAEAGCVVLGEVAEKFQPREFVHVIFNEAAGRLHIGDKLSVVVFFVVAVILDIVHNAQKIFVDDSERAGSGVKKNRGAVELPEKIVPRKFHTPS